MNKAVAVLEKLLNGGLFASHVYKWENKIRLLGDSFYGQTKAKNGIEAAEAELAEVVAQRHLNEFADALGSIGGGVLQLARVDKKGKQVHLIENTDELLYPKPYEMRDRCHMIVAFNAEHDGCGCTAVPGSRTWGKYGSLKLQAVVICYDYHFDQLCVDLVLETRKKSGPLRDNNFTMFVDGFTIVRILRDGYVGGLECCRELEFASGYWFQETLGLLKDDQSSSWLRSQLASGSGLEDRVGFPGAHEYIASHLKELGPYLTEVSRKIAEKDHKQS